MEVSVVYLAGCARELAVEVRHEIDVMTGQVSEMALAEGHEGDLGNGGAHWRGWLA